jgi:DNA polymerase-3 subunit delta
LKQQLKDNTLSGAYLFHGDEDYLKELYVGRVLKRCVNPGFEGFNLHKYDGESAELNDFIDAAQMLPMMSDRVVVLVRDFDLTSLSEDESEQFNAFMEDIPETTVIVFWCDAIKFNPKKDKKWKKIVELFEKHGHVVEFGKKDKNYLSKFVMGIASRQDRTISVGDAYYLIDTVGDDLNVLENEMQKLCAYCENGEIDRNAINTACVRTVTVKAFELTKAVSSNNLNRAFEILNVFFEQKMEPTVIMSEIITAYVDMYRAKVSLASGENSEALASDFNYGNTSFRLKNGASFASAMSVEQLRECLFELDKADMKIKQMAGDNRLAIEQLLVSLAVISNR